MTASSTAAEIENHIGDRGAVSVAEYMDICAQSYYAQGDVFGHGGDFVTAPEISQAFGEIVGLWCAVTWQQMGRPRELRLVECGPGRGTLMADALRAAKRSPGFLDAARIHLVERSDALRQCQRATLREFTAIWHDDVGQVPPGPMILIANEFLDALPIRQFQRTATGWTERLIAIRADRRLTFSSRVTTNAPVPIALAAEAEIGAIFEHSEARERFVSRLAARLVHEGGAALLIDYGHSQPALGDTLQAIKAHRYHDVLAAPGSADLTAHVDFAAVAATARAAGASVWGPIEQGIWLRRLGIAVRQMQLAQGKPADVAKGIEQGIRRLTDPHGMGLLFKVMAIAHPALLVLEGFMPAPTP